MPLINFEINFDLICSEKRDIVATNIAAQAAAFSITDTKLYYPFGPLLIQGCLNKGCLIIKSCLNNF